MPRNADEQDSSILTRKGKKLRASTRSFFVFDYEGKTCSPEHLSKLARFDTVILGLDQLSPGLVLSKRSAGFSFVRVRVAADDFNESETMSTIASVLANSGASGVVLDMHVSNKCSFSQLESFAKGLGRALKENPCLFLLANCGALVLDPRTGIERSRRHTHIWGLVQRCSGFLLENVVNYLSGAPVQKTEEADTVARVKRVLALAHKRQSLDPGFSLFVRESPRETTGLGLDLCFNRGQPTLSALYLVARFCAENGAVGCVSSSLHEHLRGLSLGTNLESVPSPIALLREMADFLAFCRQQPAATARSKSAELPEMAIRDLDPSLTKLETWQALSAPDFMDKVLPTLAHNGIQQAQKSGLTGEVAFRSVLQVIIKATRRFAKHSKHASRCHGKLAQAFEDMFRADAVSSQQLAMDKKAFGINDEVGRSPNFSFDPESCHKDLAVSKLSQLRDAHDKRIFGDFQTGKTITADELESLVKSLRKLHGAHLLAAAEPSARPAALAECEAVLQCLRGSAAHSCVACAYRLDLAKHLGPGFKQGLEKLVGLLQGHGDGGVKPMTDIQILRTQSACMRILAQGTVMASESAQFASVECFSASFLHRLDVSSHRLVVFVRGSVEFLTETLALHFFLQQGRQRRWALLALTAFGDVSASDVVGERLSARDRFEIRQSSVRELLSIVQSNATDALLISEIDQSPRSDIFGRAHARFVREASDELLGMPSETIETGNVEETVNCASVPHGFSHLVAFFTQLTVAELGSILRPTLDLMRILAVAFRVRGPLRAFLLVIDNVVRVDAVRAVACMIRAPYQYFDDRRYIATAAKLEMLGVSTSNCEAMFGGTLFNLALGVGQCLERESGQTIPDDDTPREEHRILDYIQRSTNGLFFMFPLLANMILALTIGTSQFGSTDIPDATERIVLSAGMLCGFLASGIWNTDIARILGLFQFSGAHATEATLAIRFVFAILLSGCLIGLLAAAVTAVPWVAKPQLIGLFAGGVALLAIMNNMIALLVNLRRADESIWFSRTSAIIVTSQVVDLGIIFAWKLTVGLSSGVFLLGFAIAIMLLVAGVLLVSRQRSATFTERFAVSAEDVVKWFFNERNGSARNIAHSNAAEREQDEALAWERFSEEVEFHVRNRRRAFGLPFMIKRCIGMCWSPCCGRRSLPERKAEVISNSELDLIKWYRRNASDNPDSQMPRLGTLSWERELTRATQAWILATRTEFVPRGGVLYAYCAGGSAYGVLYFAALFMHQLLSLCWMVFESTDSVDPVLVPTKSDDAAARASLWGLVFMLLAQSGLETVLMDILKTKQNANAAGDKDDRYRLPVGQIEDIVNYFNSDKKRRFVRDLVYLIPGVVVGLTVCLIGLAATAPEWQDAVQALIISLCGYVGLLLVLYTILFIETARTNVIALIGGTCFFIGAITSLVWASNDSVKVLRFAPLITNWLWAISLIIMFFWQSGTEPAARQRLPTAVSGQRFLSSSREPTEDEYEALSEDLAPEMGLVMAITPSSALGKRVIEELSALRDVPNIHKFPRSMIKNVISQIESERIAIFLAHRPRLRKIDQVRGSWAFSAVAFSFTRPGHDSPQLRIFVGTDRLREKAESLPARYIAESIIHEFCEIHRGSHYEGVAAECLFVRAPRVGRVKNSTAFLPARIRTELDVASLPTLYGLCKRRSKLLADFLGIELNDWALFSHRQRLCILELHARCLPFVPAPICDAPAGWNSDGDICKVLASVVASSTKSKFERQWFVGATLVALSVAVQVRAAEVIFKRSLDDSRVDDGDECMLGYTDHAEHERLPDPIGICRAVEKPSSLAAWDFSYLSRLAFLAFTGDAEFDSEFAHGTTHARSDGGLSMLARFVATPLRSIANLQRTVTSSLIAKLCVVPLSDDLARTLRFVKVGHEFYCLASPGAHLPLAMWSLEDCLTAVFVVDDPGSSVPSRIAILSGLKRVEDIPDVITEKNCHAIMYFDTEGVLKRVLERPGDPAHERTVFISSKGSKMESALVVTGRRSNAKFGDPGTSKSTLDRDGREKEITVLKQVSGLTRHPTTLQYRITCFYEQGFLRMRRARYDSFVGPHTDFESAWKSMTVTWSYSARGCAHVEKVELLPADANRAILSTTFDYSNGTDRPPILRSVLEEYSGKVCTGRIQAETPSFVADDVYNMLKPPSEGIRWNWMKLWHRYRPRKSRNPHHEGAVAIKSRERSGVALLLSREAVSKMDTISFSAGTARKKGMSGLRRYHLWRAWADGVLPGPYAQLLDDRILRNEPLLRDYFRYRASGKYVEAEKVLVNNAGRIYPAIDVDYGGLSRMPLRVTRMGDLYGFLPGGSAPRGAFGAGKLSSVAELLAVREFFLGPTQSKSQVPDDNLAIGPFDDPEVLDEDDFSEVPRVAAVDSGTWPADRGGVANARKDLMDGTASSIIWHGLAEIGSANRVRNFVITSAMTVEYVPVSAADLDGPNEWILADVPYSFLAFRKQLTTESIIEQLFLPILRVIARSSTTINEGGNFVRAITAMYVYFQLFDWVSTWRSPIVRKWWTRWCLESLASISHGSGRFDRASAGELELALYLLSQHMLSIVRPLPKDVLVYHVSHHGPQAFVAMVAQQLFQATIVVWDHGIFVKERAYTLSEVDWLPPLVRELLMTFFASTAAALYSVADIVSPCSPLANPDWEMFLGAIGQIGDGTSKYKSAEAWSRGSALTALRRKINPVVNGAHAARFSPAFDRQSKVPTAVMLSHLSPLKDVKNAIVAAYFIVQKLRQENSHQDYRLLVFGALDRDVDYSRECADLISRLRLHKNVQLMGEQAASVALGQAWVYLNSSQSEGLPLAVVEAAMSGVVPICTDVGGTSAIMDDGRFGKLVPPKDPAALADAQIDLLFRKGQKFLQDHGLKMRDFVLERFSMTAYVQRHHELLETAAWQTGELRKFSESYGGSIERPCFVNRCKLPGSGQASSDSFEHVPGRSSTASDSMLMHRALNRPSTHIILEMERKRERDGGYYPNSTDFVKWAPGTDESYETTTEFEEIN